MSTMHRVQVARRGFTLVELLVVITLLGILATLVVMYIVPSFQDNKNVVRGVDRVTTALLYAKQKALHDQAPRGVRFVTSIDPVTQDTIALQLIYIEQPDPLVGGGNPAPGGQLRLPVTPAGNGRPQLIHFVNTNLFGGADAGATTEFEVQPGDFFCCQGSNYPIQRVLSPTTIQIQAGHPLASTINSNPTAWQIVRQTRPTAGENPVNMPTNVVVDLVGPAIPSLVTNFQIPNGIFPSQPGNFEILFDPAGGVLNRGGSTPIIIIVRDLSSDNPLDQNTTRVLTLYPRTGQSSANPIGPSNNPLQFALSGHPSGL